MASNWSLDLLGRLVTMHFVIPIIICVQSAYCRSSSTWGCMWWILSMRMAMSSAYAMEVIVFNEVWKRFWGLNFCLWFFWVSCLGWHCISCISFFHYSVVWCVVIFWASYCHRFTIFVISSNNFWVLWGCYVEALEEYQGCVGDFEYFVVCARLDV